MLLRLVTALILAAGALAAAYVAATTLSPRDTRVVETPSLKPKISISTSVEASVTETSLNRTSVIATTATVTQKKTGFVTNDAAIDLIKQSEGLRLEAYPGGYTWLIGYGHTRTAKKGMRITEAEAEDLLRQDLADCETAVIREVTSAMTENMFGALVSICYNLGPGGMARSSMVSALNAGDYNKAADNFLLYNKATIKGEKQVLPHLADRREKERALFLAP